MTKRKDDRTKRWQSEKMAKRKDDKTKRWQNEKMIAESEG
jgi:hypothetical protein